MIATNRLILRPFTLKDTGKVFEMSIEDGMKHWIPDQVYADENEAREILGFLINCYTEADPTNKPFVLGTELISTGELIGHAGLSPLNHGEVEIGYAVEEKYQGKGYATEAVRALSEYGLKHFGLKSVTGVVDSANSGSVRVLEKAGYRFVREEVRNAFGRTVPCSIFIFGR